MKSFKEIIAKAKAMPLKTFAVAGELDDELEKAFAKAEKEGIAKHIVFKTAKEAVLAVRNNQADIIMKGSSDTKDLMKAVLDKDEGLRSGNLMSHIAVVEAMGRFLLITDGGICINPSLEEKVEIIKNALPVAKALGIDKPKVAVLAAIEKVNPKMPETVDAKALEEMTWNDCLVQGPLALDNAVSVESARIKGITGEVAGKADILLVPSVLAGNLLAKGILYFGGCAFGGLAAGASKPVCFLSRADNAETKFNTIALGKLCFR